MTIYFIGKELKKGSSYKQIIPFSKFILKDSKQLPRLYGKFE